jgi:hypothetical protein
MEHNGSESTIRLKYLVTYEKTATLDIGYLFQFITIQQPTIQQMVLKHIIMILRIII